MARNIRNLASAAAVWASLGAAALAQGAPVPRAADSPPTWLYVIVIVVLAAATFGASVMPSKRGHQD